MKRPLLKIFVPLYAAVTAAKNRAYTREPFRAHRLREPVISIGSLSAGGAGKTPVVAALAALLQTAGYSVDVLTRGYGRISKAVEQVDPAGDAQRFGDEPLMLARATGVPVFVGAERLAAGQLAEQLAQPRRIEQGSTEASLLHLLDDGFGHRKLARSMDVVLLTRAELEDSLLPAGNLREPLESLGRAHAIVLREEEAEFLQATVRHHAADVPLWIIRREIQVDPPPQPFAFCALARPDDFFASLPATAGTAAFRDHHLYTGNDIEKLLQKAHAAKSRGFVTTEKDAVKLTPALRAKLETLGPLRIASLRVAFCDPAEVLHTVAARLAAYQAILDQEARDVEAVELGNTGA